MKKCKKCGKLNFDNSKYCEYCGQHLCKKNIYIPIVSIAVLILNIASFLSFCGGSIFDFSWKDINDFMETVFICVSFILLINAIPITCSVLNIIYWLKDSVKNNKSNLILLGVSLFFSFPALIITIYL